MKPTIVLTMLKHGPGHGLNMLQDGTRAWHPSHKKVAFNHGHDRICAMRAHQHLTPVVCVWQAVLGNYSLFQRQLQRSSKAVAAPQAAAGAAEARLLQYA